MDEGVTRGIFEIFETIIPIALLLLIGGAIFFVANPNFVRAYSLEKEISYISSITSDNMVVELNLGDTKLKDIKVDSVDNNVKVTVKKSSSSTSGTGSGVISEKTSINQKSDSIILISK